jgi:hypothetical protein
MKKLDYITLYGPPMQGGYDIHVERKMHIFDSETKAAVATIEHSLKDQDAKQYANLFVAAPMLLESLEDVLRMWKNERDHYETHCRPYVEEAEKAIRMARGIEDTSNLPM